MDTLKCPKCKNHFNDKRMVPLILPKCGHTYCSKCIKSDVKIFKNFKCILDSKMYDCEIVDQFPINQMIINLIRD